ncbi:MAG: nucleotidyltransferase domain-containing protein [Bacteroidales bacterium]|nr:nucleotidyltransferase domain-containing protein [Bacteroidales bacterium]
MISQHDLDIVVSRIIEFYNPEKVILFGSYANGSAHEGSDLDLLLVKQTNEHPLNRAAGIRKAMRDILLPMDILVYTPEEIAKDKERKFTFIHNVLKSGKVLYAIK